MADGGSIFPRAERDCHSRRGVPGGPGSSELRGRDPGRHLRLLSRLGDQILGGSAWWGDPLCNVSGSIFLFRRENWSGPKFGCSATKPAAFFSLVTAVIRHLISIPAGIVRMNFWVFSAVTIVGSALWLHCDGLSRRQSLSGQPDLIGDPDAWFTCESAVLWIVLFVKFWLFIPSGVAFVGTTRQSRLVRSAATVRFDTQVSRAVGVIHGQRRAFLNILEGESSIS